MELGPLFGSVVRDLKNRMNVEFCYRFQFTTSVIFYSQNNNEELEPIHYHSYSWIFNKNNDIKQSQLNSNLRNMYTSVIENKPRSGFVIDYRMTKLPNYVGGTYKESPKLVRTKKACINIKNNDNKCLFDQYSLIFIQLKNMQKNYQNIKNMKMNSTLEGLLILKWIFKIVIYLKINLYI